MTCRYPDCTNEVAAPGMSRCSEHALSWQPGKPVERSPIQESPWVRRAREGKLPPKQYGMQA